MSNFAIYLAGIAVVAGALGYGAYLLGVPGTWIGIIIAVIVGFGLMGGVQKTRRRERPRD